jgi:hypothetical protein
MTPRKLSTLVDVHLEYKGAGNKTDDAAPKGFIDQIM